MCAKSLKGIVRDFKSGSVPRLTDRQKTQLKDLAAEYQKNYTKFVYDNTKIRNIYLDKSAFDANGKAIVNCGLLSGLLWGGVSPDTFIGKSATYTGQLEKAFDWGFQFEYPNRIAHKVTTDSDGLYGFIKPNADSYVGSSSYNTYYGEISTRSDKQIFYSFATCADMANELYMKGFEIPIAEIDVGDLVFYRSRSLVDGLDDNADSFRFRNITHVAMVTNIDHKDSAQIGIIESTNMLGADYPINYCNHWSSTVMKLRSAFLTNNIVMVARHPSAFGVASNLGDKFNAL